MTTCGLRGQLVTTFLGRSRKELLHRRPPRPACQSVSSQDGAVGVKGTEPREGPVALSHPPGVS